MKNAKRLLIYAPVPLHQTPEGLTLEDQACNGLRLWAENFETVTAMYPVEHGPKPPSWQPIETVGANLERIDLVSLPTAYRPDQFLRHYRETRDLIRSKIDEADYLCFSIGGMWGDWGSVSCHQAYKKGRPYAVWTDRVESEVVRRTSHSGPFRRRLRARLEHRPMAMLERHLIRRSSLGLFHGKETYDAYAPYCPQPHIVHDIHVHKSEHLQADALKAKIKAAGNTKDPEPLNIVYTGRASAMKGPQDWVAVLKILHDAGVAFHATWLGDGPDLADMQTAAERAGISEHITFAGFVRDRAVLLDHLRRAHIFLFCHKTPESPRCLIEALISGTPIVGYDGAFARDLISGHQGGKLVPLHDVGALAEAVKDLAGARENLAQMIGAAAKDGAPYDDESVFEHRSEIIRQYL